MKTGYSLQKKIIARGLILVLLIAALASIRPQKAYAYTDTLFKYTVRVKKNYLALRNAKAFERKNEIGELYSGDTVIHCPTSSENSTYWYVYSPKLNKLGYVNRNYLEFDEEYEGHIHYTAKVKKGYLALRSAKKYDAKNEKGKMYTGDEVIVLHKSGGDYWTVYSPDLEKAGYTNKHYLRYDEDYYDDDDDDYYDDDDDEYYDACNDYNHSAEKFRRNGNYTTMTQTNTLVFSRDNE